MDRRDYTTTRTDVGTPPRDDAGQPTLFDPAAYAAQAEEVAAAVPRPGRWSRDATTGRAAAINRTVAPAAACCGHYVAAAMGPDQHTDETTAQIARALDVTERTVERHLRTLTDAGLFERRRVRRGGCLRRIIVPGPLLVAQDLVSPPDGRRDPATGGAVTPTLSVGVSETGSENESQTARGGGSAAAAAAAPSPARAIDPVSGPPRCRQCGGPTDLDADGRPWPRCRTCAFGAPVEPGQSPRPRRMSDIPRDGDKWHMAVDDPHRETWRGGWLCRRRGCGEPVNLDRLKRPFDLCLDCQTAWESTPAGEDLPEPVDWEQRERDRSDREMEARYGPPIVGEPPPLPPPVSGGGPLAAALATVVGSLDPPPEPDGDGQALDDGRAAAAEGLRRSRETLAARRAAGMEALADREQARGRSADCEQGAAAAAEAAADGPDSRAPRAPQEARRGP